MIVAHFISAKSFSLEIAEFYIRLKLRKSCKDEANVIMIRIPCTDSSSLVLALGQSFSLSPSLFLILSHTFGSFVREG